MPRLPRVEVEGAVNYITSKGSHNQPIFQDEADYKIYLDLLSKYASRHKFKLYSYCLLSSHLHLLIQTGGTATISQVMHDLNSFYTKYFNARYGRRGPLFEARFKSVLVEKDSYLLKMTRHIHRLAPRDDYPFSSYPHFISPAQASGSGVLNLQEEIREIFGLLRNESKSLDHGVYCLEDDQREIEDLEKRLRRGSVLGSVAFADKVKNRIRDYSKDKIEPGFSTPRKSNHKILPVVFWLAIAGTSVSTLFLYTSKARLTSKYETLLQQKESEFKEKSQFQHRSPLALSDLEGTEWEIEMVPLPADKAKGTLKDKIRFKHGRFSSDYFSSQGFKSTNFSLTPQPGSPTIWETMQSALDGGTISWRGDWQGDAMKGVLSVKPATKTSVGLSGGIKSSGGDFSFFSLNWTHTNEAK